MTDQLTGADLTALETATETLVSTATDVTYSIFNFTVNQIATYVGLIAAVVVIYMLFRYARRHMRKVL